MSIIAGVDGCKAGWLCIKKNIDTGVVSSGVFSNAQSLIRQKPEPLVIAVDIPIGLMESDPRQCDIEARKLLDIKRKPSIFPAPIRSIIRLNTFEEANAVSKQILGKGISQQTHAICKKILQFDEILSEQPALQKRIKEIHPEVCFWACNNDKSIPHNKKSEEGLKERHKIISEYFGHKAIMDVRSKYHVNTVAHDDIYDAFIALWTAERIYKGNAGLIPNPSPCDEKGIHMEMWY